MRWLGKARFGFLQRQAGILLLEIMVALGILAVIGVTRYGEIKLISWQTVG